MGSPRPWQILAALMEPRTIKIVVIGIAIILLFQFLRVAARGEGLLANEKLTLIETINKRCLADLAAEGRSLQVSSPYCRCFADRMGEAITQSELRLTALTPDIKKKMEIAADSCVSGLIHRSQSK